MGGGKHRQRRSFNRQGGGILNFLVSPYIVPCTIRDTPTEILYEKNCCMFLARPMENMTCSTASIDLYVAFSERTVAKYLPETTI